MTVMTKRNDIKARATLRNDGRVTVTIRLIGFDVGVLDLLADKMPRALSAALDNAITEARKGKP